MSSGNLGPQASTKGETSKPTSKTGYDRIDINKLFKGKTTEPVAKTVTQKHGMQSLGKALPARRAGASVVVKPESISNDTTNNSTVPLPQQPPLPSSVNLGQPISQQDQQKWTNSTHPHGPPIMSVPNVPRAGPPTHDKNWSGPDVSGNYQSQRFAQEFPSLEAGSEPRGSMTNSSQPQAGSGPQNSSKSHDNQYGPGPILRPQTGGRETQGGGRGAPRPPGPHSQNAPTREPGPERPNLGGPTPPPMSLGQGGPAPPPLGAYPMQFRGMAPFMYPNGPGPGYYPQSGQGLPRYGMQVPPGAPPAREHPDSHRESNRGRGPPPPMRPTQQFAVKPIIREEDMKRMDDIDQEGTWSSVKDEVDYNKKISFSDEEEGDRHSSRKSAERNDDESRPTRDSRDKKQTRILERQQSSNERDRDRYESASKDQGKADLDREEEWNNKSRNAPQYDSKDRGTGSSRRGRDSREDDWRGSRFEEDARNKKGPPSRPDQRGTDYSAKQFSNLPPRLLRQQQHQHNSQPFSTSQRRSPSPSSSGIDRDFREREWDNEKRQGTTQYRILERNRGDSESSCNSIRDKRTNSDYNSRSSDKESTRSSSDTKGGKDQSIESLKEKMEGSDARNEKEDKSSGFGKTTKFSSSWADQVDDEDNARDYENYQKGLNMAPVKAEVKEERSVPKRVYIQQRKVENMTTTKVEIQSESSKPTVEPVKQDKSASDQNRTLAVWGEHDKDQSKSDNKVEISEENSRNRSIPAEREIILSDKARQLHHNRNEPREKYDKRSQEKELKESNDYDKGRDRYSSNQETESQQDREKSWVSRTERPRSSRWGSNDFRNENRTPERDATTSSGQSSSNTIDNSNSTKPGVEGDRLRAYDVEKSRSTEMIKENSASDKEGKGNRDNYVKHKDFDKSSSFDKRNKNAHDEDNDPQASSKGIQKTRERTGHGVYQPRGGWGRQESRGGKSSRGGRDYYDNRPRRNDYDRERDDRIPKEEQETDNQEKPTDKDSVISNEEVKDSCDDEKSRKDFGAGDTGKKGMKSPVTNKRHPRGGGGGRLHGYGPPSDKPFSVGNANKEEEHAKEKLPDSTIKGNPTSSSGPVPIPLMELGDISPPSMMAGRARHHGRGKGVGTVPPRPERQESYSSRGGSKRGRGGDAAKPLMSLNSNELEKHEGDTEPESQDDETKKNSRKKDSTRGHEKHRQNQNEHKTMSKEKLVTESSNQDLSNNNKGKVGKSLNVDGDVFYSGHSNEIGTGSASDNSENLDSDGQPKKGSSKERLNVNSNRRIEKQPQIPNKDRRVKHQPYDAHSRSTIAPRFQKESSENSNSWEKSALKPDHNSQQMSQPTSQTESKVELLDTKPPTSMTSIINPSSVIMDGGPLKTMIFENRNYKNVSKPAGSGKGNENKDSSMTSGLELAKDIGMSFGKQNACFLQDTGNDGHEMDFVSGFEDPSDSQTSQNISSYPTTKPNPIGPNRNFQQHQPSPVSPLAKDLTEKIQAVRQVWDKPAMTSVAEQQCVASTPEDSNNFHSGYTVSDAFKTDVPRDYTSSLQQQHQSNYAPGSSPAISKPDSSTSPNSNPHRQVKPPQQQSNLENHVGMSSSPFAYSMPQQQMPTSMPQQHQGAPFGGASAIPSPPTAMVYGNSQGLGGHTGVYQAFPHVDSSQVMSNSARSQYGQYSNPQGTSTPYGLGTSIFMTSMDTSGQMPSYQQIPSYQHSHHQQHSQSGQGPSPSNRSPGPMPSSGGTNSGVMNSLKSQSTGAHPNISHQVMGTPSQQGYSQMSHHHSGMPHHQLPPVGHVASKPTGPGYTQTGITTQSQIYIPYDPSQQQVLNFGGQSYVSSGMRNPPPSATPPVQGMQGSSNYYSANANNPVFPGTNQGSGLQQLHVAVAPNPQALQNLQTATQQYGQQQFQITGFNQLQGYGQQAASTVSALNLGGQLIRPGPNTHSHYNMKQGMDMVQQSHLNQPGLKSHEPMMNPTWNAQGFPLNQGFHGGNKAAGNQDRNSGSNIGNQRKGSHQQMGGMGNMGGVKYMAGGGYASQQKVGRYATPGPIQRPVSTSPIGPPGSIGQVHAGMRMVGMKPNDNLNKHLSSINQPGSVSEEGLLDKFMTESHNRSISNTPDPSKVIMSGSRLIEDPTPDHNGADNATLKNHNLAIAPAKKSPIISSEK